MTTGRINQVSITKKVRLVFYVGSASVFLWSKKLLSQTKTIPQNNFPVKSLPFLLSTSKNIILFLWALLSSQPSLRTRLQPNVEIHLSPLFLSTHFLDRQIQQCLHALSHHALHTSAIPNLPSQTPSQSYKNSQVSCQLVFPNLSLLDTPQSHTNSLTGAKKSNPRIS